MFTQESNIKATLQYRNGAKLEVYKNRKFITFISNNGKPALQIFKGKQKNPYSNYYYQNEERRNMAISNAKESADAEQSYKEKRAEERKSFVPEFEVGEIFSSSWGYEQTNVDFYQVVEKPSKHYAVIRKIAQDTVEGSVYSHGMACEVVAVPNAFISTETQKKKVGRYGIKLSSYSSAYKWDCRPKYKSWYY